MNAPKDKKMTGINGWFIIEIFSFYGYIFSACFFIFERIILSSLGMLADKNSASLRDVYKYDVVSYFGKDLDWLAFVTILLIVNICL